MSQQKRSVQRFAFALLSLTASMGYGDTSSSSVPAAATPSVTATAPTASAGKFYGMLDVRPSLSATGNNSWMENAVEAGYSFNSNVRLSYLAAFDNNLADSSRPGFGVKMWNGFARMRVKNILVSDDKSLSFNYQGRLYTPNDPDEQAKGHITSLRTYLTVKKVFSPTLTMSLSEVPILHAYSKDAQNNSANKSLYENMMILDATIQIAGPVSLYFPIVYNLANYRNVPGAKRSGAQTSLIYIYPELDIALNSVHTVGISYYSANLVKDDLSALTLGDGLRGGVAQLFWTAEL